MTTVAEAICHCCGGGFSYTPRGEQGRSFCSKQCYWKMPKSSQTKAKISEASRGRTNNSNGNGGATKGRKATGKQLEGLRAGWEKQKNNPRKPSQETREKLRRAHIGKKLPESQKRKIGAASQKTWDSMTEYQKRKRLEPARQARRGKPAPWFQGSNNPNWKGGVHTHNATERKIFERSSEYISWRRQVFRRDNFTCQECNLRGVELHAHHIKSYTKYPDLRTEVSNGITLCKECHMSLHGLSPKEAG